MYNISLLMVAACGLSHTSAIADIDCTDSINFTTSFFGFSSQSGEYLVVGERASLSGTSALIISGDDPTDYLGNIFVELNTSIAPLDVRLFVRDGVADRTSIGVLEQISKDAGFALNIDVVAITGDLGASGQPSVVNANTIRLISLGGDCYADIRGIDGNPQFDAGILIDGSWKKGAAAFKGQSIDFLDVGGDIGSTTESVEIWSSGTIDLIDVEGDFFGTIGENSLGFTDDTAVELLDVAGDFNGTAPMILQALDDVAVGGNFDADITVLDPLDSISTYDIGGEFSSTSTLSFPSSGLERPDCHQHVKLERRLAR